MDDIIQTDTFQHSGSIIPGVNASLNTALFQELIQKANDAYFIFRISQDGKVSRFLEVNPVACKTTGYSRDELLSMTVRDLACGYTSPAHLKDAEEKAFCEPYTTMEWVHINREGRILPLELAIRVVQRDNISKDKFVFMIARDISERKEFENAMHRMAYFDDKTGLPNRRKFTQVLTEGLERALKAGSKPAVVFVDLDNFKQVNDVYGYNIGDEVLVSAARRIRACFPPNCVVARWGDDEFLMLVPDGDFALQTELLVRMRTLFGAPFLVDNQQIFLALSAGIAVFPDDGDSPDTLIQNAGTAVSEAKRNGKSQLVHYTEALHKRVSQRLQLAVDLRRAIVEDEFRLHFQPEIHAKERRLVGMEALIRWQHPKFGLVYPDNFISAAEEAGLIGHIGEKVFRNACMQARTWEKRGLKDYRMAVNLSVLQLQQPDFLKSVEKVLKETGMDPGRCQFEITESVFMHVEAVQDILLTLQDFGITIAIDDFGTGFSSLSYLRKLPIHLVKVDRSFVGNLLTSKNDWVIVKAIVDLAHQLGLSVVAEGIETSEQEAALQSLGCDFMQGYLYSKPVPAEEFQSKFVS